MNQRHGRIGPRACFGHVFSNSRNIQDTPADGNDVVAALLRAGMKNCHSGHLRRGIESGVALWVNDIPPETAAERLREAL